MAKLGTIAFCVVITLSCCPWAVLGKDCVDVHLFLKYMEKLMISLPYHTVPVFNLCTNETAIVEYHNATAHYRNMTNAPECQPYLVSNRLNVYETAYNQLTGLWSSANCDACAAAVNETAEFMHLSNALDLCIGQHSASPCEPCADDYQRVQTFYAQLEKAQHGPDRMCFDVADRMNKSRLSWSGTHNCCNDKRHSMVAFAAIGSVACALPLLFYAVMHFVTVRQEARQISLLSHATNEERPAGPSSSSGPRPSNGGVVRQPEMERIAETDGDEEDEEEEEEVEEEQVAVLGEKQGKQTVPVSPVSLKINNLNVNESKLIDLAQSDQRAAIPESRFAQKANLPQDGTDDESLLG